MIKNFLRLSLIDVEFYDFNFEYLICKVGILLGQDGDDKTWWSSFSKDGGESLEDADN